MNSKQKDEFEYNDGLGDLLKEKDKRQFSWGKTSAIIIFLSVIAFIWISLLFKPNTEKTQKHPTGHPTSETLFDDPSQKKAQNNKKIDKLQNKLAQIERDNRKLINEIDSMLTPKTKKKAQKNHQAAIKKDPSQRIYNIITGSFIKKSNAVILENKLRKIDINSLIRKAMIKNNTYYRVQAGSYTNYKNAKNQLKRLKENGFDAYIIQE